MSQACGNCCLCPSLVEPLTDIHWAHLESLLCENQPPSDLEKQTLVKVEHDIEEYDLAIARLQSAVVSLKSQRDAAKDYVLRLKSLMAPIRRLSNDVLVEIFTYLCADTVLDSSRTFTRLPQLYLCQVCKHWRSLVNDSPLLWSTLKLWSGTDYLFSQDFIYAATLSNLANLILNRSGNCPLTIMLHDYRDVHPVSVLLLKHADRWLSASVTGCSQRFFSVSSFPQLKHLNFNFERCDTQTTPAMLSLESLNICQLARSSRPLERRPLPNFPWKQLKKLVLAVPFLSHYAFVVSRCIQLQHLTLSDWRLESDQEDSLPPVSIASQTIISLTLRYMKKAECEKPFPLLQFPQLHILELEECHLPAGSTYPSPFIAHSLSITSLSLVDLYLSLEDLLALLRLLPTVTHFSFYQCWRKETLLVENFFSKFRHAHPSESRTLLPCFTHMEMQFLLLNGGADPATSAFVEMVKNRVAENRLKSVRLLLPTQCLNHELISSLAYLSKVGIAISVQDKCGLILQVKVAIP